MTPQERRPRRAADALVAAGNGVAVPVPAPIALFNAGVAFAAAEAAFYAAHDAAYQAMVDAFHAREMAAQAHDQELAEYEETYLQARDECLNEILP